MDRASRKSELHANDCQEMRAELAPLPFNRSELIALEDSRRIAGTHTHPHTRISREYEIMQKYSL